MNDDYNGMERIYKAGPRDPQDPLSVAAFSGAADAIRAAFPRIRGTGDKYLARRPPRGIAAMR